MVISYGLHVDTSALIETLRDPAAYPFAVDGEVGVVQTHISILFFAGDRVFKVKKAVDLGFLDYRSLEDRRRFCEEEVRLNRRLAPDTYLGVVPVTRDASGVLRVGSAEAAAEVREAGRVGGVAGVAGVIDWAVEMRRLPADRMMSACLERDEVTGEQLDALVTLLVDFHARCATGAGVDEHAAPDELRRQVDENFEAIARFTSAEPCGGVGGALGARTLSKVLHAHLHRAAVRFLDEHRALLERRLREGRVREGHGDLHAGNICLTGAGIVIYDCIEFTPRFRCRDVAGEMAFLAMDLDARGHRDFARRLLHRYAALAADGEMDALVGFYKLHFAVVRGKVDSLEAVDAAMAPEERDAARREAMRYFQLAASYTLPPALILTCGLPATGKSTVARAIARPFDAAVLRSDEIRKELAGLRPTDRGGAGPGEGIYTAAFSRRTYDEIRRRAGRHLDEGHTVVIDAMLPSARTRREMLEAAAGHGAPAVMVHCTCPDEIVRARLRARRDDPDEVSDAGEAVYEDARRRFEPPDEVPATMLVTAGAERTGEEVASDVVDKLIEAETEFTEEGRGGPRRGS